MKTTTRIQQAFACTEAEANLALYLIKLGSGVTEFIRRTNEFPRTCEWIDKCYHAPRNSEIALSALDELLDTSGVESIETSEFIDSYHGYIRASYLNTGETYAITILLDHRERRWRIISWGDFVDRIEGEETESGVVAV